MESLSTELRKAREARGMSLAEIADATLINIRFLEHIERGDFSFLPRTYVRAFVREYAATVGLDPAPVLRALEEPAPTPSATSASPAEQPAPPTAVPPPQEHTPRRQIDPSTARIAIVIIVIVVVAIALWNILGSHEPAAVSETPFDAVRSEQERRASADTTAPAVPPPVAPARDSLVLTVVVVDSAWLQIGIDDSAMRSLSLKPGRKATWKAARRFVLTLGNAGAVEFTLNRKSLGKLGKPGSTVRNIELTHATLTRK